MVANNQILLKNSGVKGKLPDASDAAYGELFVNYHSGDPMLCFKDNAGAIIQIKPARSIDGGGGETPPDIGNETGDVLWDGTHLLVWDGTEWVAVAGYWKLDGNDLKPVDDANNLVIGGAITATSQIQAGGDPNDGNNAGAKLHPAGVVVATRATASAGSAVFMGFTEGTAAPTSRINADGSVSAAGAIESGPGVTGDAGKVQIFGGSSSDGDLVFDVYNGSGSPIQMFGSGSITAAGGNCTIDSDGVLSAAQCSLSGAGAYITVDRNKTPNSTDILFQGKTQGVEKFTVATEGSATFAGMVKANGGLEAYIPTNNLASFSQRWFDDRSSARSVAASMGVAGQFFTKSSVMVGGTTSVANIQLAGSDGSIKAAGDVTALNGNIKLQAEGSGGQAYIYNGNASTEAFRLTNDSSASRIWFKSNGNSYFQGEMSVGGSISSGDATSDANIYAYIEPGRISARNTGTSGVAIWNGYPTGSGSTPSSTINSDGSATFANGKFAIEDTGQFYFEPAADTGKISTTYSGGVVNSASLTGKDKDGTETFRLKTDGSATFAGTITGNGNILSNRTSATNTCFQATLNGVTNATISAGGSATFAGKIDAGVFNSGDEDAQGTRVYSDGIVYQQVPKGYPAGGDAYQIWHGGEKNVSFTTGGAATFTGDVTANNVTFNLNPDDPNSWNVTEETYTDTETYEIEVPVIETGVGTADLVDGDERETRTVTKTREVEKTREVREYVGETMHVKETLLAITGALEGLKTAAETATTCDDLKAAIGEALAGIAAPSTGTADKKTKRNGKRK